MMSEANISHEKRFDLKGALTFLLHPRQEYERLFEKKNPAWFTPMVILSVFFLLSVLVSGLVRARAAAMGEMPLPVDWQWMTPDMQNNYMQAQQATQGPVFLYIIPAVTGLAGLWLGWAILSGLLHLGSTLLGGRGSMAGAMTVTAWASLPLAIRYLMRVFFMLIAGRTISAPGLAGFITSTEGGALFLANVLKNVDIFLLLQILLLVLGLSIWDSLPKGKAVAAVLTVKLAILLAGAGLGVLGSSLGGMIITRPFM